MLQEFENKINIDYFEFLFEVKIWLGKLYD